MINPAYDYPVVKKKEAFRWNRIWLPLDLANCAALLERQGSDAVIIDANAERLTPEEVAKKVRKFDKIFITSASIDRWQCPHIDIRTFLETVKAVKEVKADEIYVMGPHGTFRPKEILEMTKVSGVIVGEPELTVLDICEKERVKRVQGLYFIDGGRTLFRPRRKFLDLNSLPIPSFHLLPMKKYSYEILGNNFALFEASRGCPYSCIFCTARQMYGPYYRIKDAEKLIEEIEYAIENFDVKTAYFIDLEFTLNNRLNRGNVEKLCDLLTERNFDLRWSIQTRADSIDYELLKKVKRAGCELIHFGVETGSEKVLKLINKKMTFKQIENAIRLTKKVGIKSVAFFMFGLPFETIKDMMDTIEFAKKLDPTYASFNIATPYPNTIFYEMVKDEVDEIFPIAYEGMMKVEDLKKIINHALIQFYLRPSYIIKRALSEDPKFLIGQLELFLSFLR